MLYNNLPTRILQEEMFVYENINACDWLINAFILKSYACISSNPLIVLKTTLVSKSPEKSARHVEFPRPYITQLNRVELGLRFHSDAEVGQIMPLGIWLACPQRDLERRPSSGSDGFVDSS